MHLDKVTETANREWYLYLIQTAAGALYTGVSTDVERRFTAHSRGQGAKALRGRGPLTLVFSRPSAIMLMHSDLNTGLNSLPGRENVN